MVKGVEVTKAMGFDSLLGRIRMSTWSGRRDSNPRPSAPKADALPDCATPRLLLVYRIGSATASQCAEQAMSARAEQRVEETIEDPSQQKHR
jgi:hypothetical protein